MPDSQKLSKSDFRLDKRLQFHVRDIISLEMKDVRKVLNFDVEKSQLKLYKMKRHFIDCLAAFHIEIPSIRFVNKSKYILYSYSTKMLQSDNI